MRLQGLPDIDLKSNAISNQEYVIHFRLKKDTQEYRIYVT